MNMGVISDVRSLRIDCQSLKKKFASRRLPYPSIGVVIRINVECKVGVSDTKVGDLAAVLLIFAGAQRNLLVVVDVDRARSSVTGGHNHIHCTIAIHVGKRYWSSTSWQQSFLCKLEA